MGVAAIVGVWVHAGPEQPVKVAKAPKGKMFAGINGLSTENSFSLPKSISQPNFV